MIEKKYIEQSENRKIIEFPKQKKKLGTYFYLHDRGSKIKRFSKDHVIYEAGIMKILFEEAEWILKDTCNEVLPDLVPGFDKFDIEPDYRDDKNQFGKIIYGTNRKQKRIDGSKTPKRKGIIGEESSIQIGDDLNRVIRHVQHGRNYFIHHWQYQEMRRIWKSLEGRIKIIEGFELDRTMLTEFKYYFFALRVYWGRVKGLKTFVEKDKYYQIIIKDYLPKVLDEFGLTKLPQS